MEWSGYLTVSQEEFEEERIKNQYHPAFLRLKRAQWIELLLGIGPGIGLQPGTAFEAVAMVIWAFSRELCRHPVSCATVDPIATVIVKLEVGWNCPGSG